MHGNCISVISLVPVTYYFQSNHLSETIIFSTSLRPSGTPCLEHAAFVNVVQIKHCISQQSPILATPTLMAMSLMGMLEALMRERRKMPFSHTIRPRSFSQVERAISLSLRVSEEIRRFFNTPSNRSCCWYQIKHTLLTSIIIVVIVSKSFYQSATGGGDGRGGGRGFLFDRHGVSNWISNNNRLASESLSILIH